MTRGQCSFSSDLTSAGLHGISRAQPQGHRSLASSEYPPSRPHGTGRCAASLHAVPWPHYPGLSEALPQTATGEASCHEPGPSPCCLLHTHLKQKRPSQTAERRAQKHRPRVTAYAPRCRVYVRKHRLSISALATGCR